jgi:protein O-mannosyl-transferase
LGKRSRSKHDSRAAVAAPPPPSATIRDRAAIRTLAVCASLVVIVLAIYAQVAGHDFINYDDPIYVSNNPQVLRGLTAGGFRWAMTTVDGAHWHPVTWLSHMLDVSLFGRVAGRHLLVNVSFHAASSVLLFLWLRLATGAFWRSSIVAALFAVHPLHVESVAWLSERKDVLSVFFMVLSLLAYTLYVRRRSRAQYAWSIVALALGVMAKPMLVTFPFVLLLLDEWPLRREAPISSRLLEKVPHFAVIIPPIVLTLHAQQVAMAGGNLPLAVRIANAAISYVRYLGKTVWPANLAVVYPYSTTVSSALAIVCALLLIALTAGAVALRRRAPWVAVGWLWFLGTLVPVIGIVQAGQQSMADRFTYIPHIGLFIAVIWSVAAVIEGAPELRKAAAAAAAACILIFAIVAHAQTSYWRNSATLFEHAVAVTENNGLAHVNLGAALYDEGQAGRAEAEYRAAAGYKPEDVQHLGLAMALGAQGKLDEAAKEAGEAVRINPANADAFAMLGTVELSRGHKTEAVAALQQASILKPDAQTLGRLALARGDAAEAKKQFAAAAGRQGDSADAHQTYAVALAKEGDDAGAMREFKTALRLNPAFYDARMNFGALLSRTGKEDDAIRQFSEASALRPQSVEPRIYLALAQANQKRFTEAADQIARAIAADHDGANRFLTEAIHMAPRPNAIDEYVVFLRQQAGVR